MIKQKLFENQIHLSIDNEDFSYRIPLKKIGHTIDWKIGEKVSDHIELKHVSKWALKLFTKNVTNEEFISQFKAIVKAYAPDHTIDWEETLMAIQVQNEYNSLIKENKLNEEEIISSLNTKYKLDIT
ncbi:hypothetical protein [Brumimicrobium oceani]|uniref:Uncharacterized protein n=1 Tax=Brumimicrobium oceani TaxID=2100725 RepID=A0A2U2XHD8_9FLAO|nr:hypothetical protein [Brumimicrobium oceani]PWH87205.1 hypothetical protein DIT68_02780 [Brumimicrobium oceani]